MRQIKKPTNNSASMLANRAKAQLNNAPKKQKVSKKMHDRYVEVIGEETVERIDSNPSLIDQYNNRIEYAEKIKENAEKEGVELAVVAPETKEKLPLEVLVDPKQNNVLPKHALWVLSTLSSVSKKELDEYFDALGDDAPVSERLSYNLINGALDGDKEYEKMYWQLQANLAKSSAIQSQINQNVTAQNTSVLTQILDEIEAKVEEAEVVKNQE